MTSKSIQVGGSHYEKMEIDVFEFCQKNRIPFIESTAIKYICRHRKKDGDLDIDKAISCLQRLKNMEYPKRNLEIQQIETSISRKN